MSDAPPLSELDLAAVCRTAGGILTAFAQNPDIINSFVNNQSPGCETKKEKPSNVSEDKGIPKCPQSEFYERKFVEGKPLCTPKPKKEHKRRIPTEEKSTIACIPFNPNILSRIFSNTSEIITKLHEKGLYVKNGNVEFIITEIPVPFTPEMLSTGILQGDRFYFRERPSNKGKVFLLDVAIYNSEYFCWMLHFDGEKATSFTVNALMFLMTKDDLDKYLEVVPVLATLGVKTLKDSRTIVREMSGLVKSYRGQRIICEKAGVDILFGVTSSDEVLFKTMSPPYHLANTLSLDDLETLIFGEYEK